MQLVKREPTDTIGHPNQEDVGCVDKLAIFSETIDNIYYAIRFCVNFRKLNSVTKRDAYPIPRIDDTLDALSGAKWFQHSIWQVATGK